MRALIREFRGIADLDAEIGGILLLAGSNGAGKSSAAMALAAAASGTLLPGGLTKTQAKLLVRDGAREAVVELTQGEALARVRWPAAERVTVGTFRDASPMACGLENPALMAAKDRAAWFGRAIGAEPTKEDLEKALPASIPEDRFAEVWRAVQARGWNGAHADAKEEGAKLKGGWERVTGERFGAQKAAAWQPSGWTEADDRGGERLVDTRLAQWQKLLDAAIARQAVSAEELARLRSLAEQIAPLEAELAGIESDANEKLAAVEQASRARAACPPLSDFREPVACPHCGGTLIVIGNRVEATTLRPESAEALAEEIRCQIVAADAAVAEARGPALEAERKLMQAKSALKHAREAGQKLADAPVSAENSDAVAEARAGLAAAQAKRSAYHAVREARALAAQIESQAAIVKTLAEDGARKVVLADRLGRFNADLEEVCRRANWGAVAVDAEMALSYGGRPFALCSGGEQFRVRITLQLAVTMRESAPLVVIDGADILDRAGRNGLLNALADFGLPAVVGMTLTRAEEMPDLAAAGIGRSVWIERGTAATAERKAA